MSLPLPIIAVLVHFAPAFTQPTWRKVLVLLVGTLRARGRRTVTAALRQMGHQHDPHFNVFHHVLNRASWSALDLSGRLLQLLVATFVAAGGRLTIVIDETLERRWGTKITKRGHYRDKVRSSKEQSVSSSGLRWVTMMLIVQVPWTSRHWALPFLSVLATTPKVSAELGKRHKTVPDLAGQMILVVRRWLPTTPITLVGDSAYSCVELGLCCARHQVALIAPLRLDACLYAPAPARTKKTMGRPRLKGAALPKLAALLSDLDTVWQRVPVRWYDGTTQEIEICSGTGLWYRAGVGALALRWVLTRDPSGQREVRAYFTTDPAQEPVSIVSDFINRWSIEVTFEESRAHLGVETQRQWSDLAIERSTPCLLGLYSVVTLLGQALYPDGRIPVQRAAWYDKSKATFSDVLGAVRAGLWNDFRFSTSPHDPDMLLVPRGDLAQLAYAVCY